MSTHKCTLTKEQFYKVCDELGLDDYEYAVADTKVDHIIVKLSGYARRKLLALGHIT